MKSDNFSFRIKLLFFCVLAVAGVLVYRLYNVQIVSGDEFRELADRQYTRPNTNLFERGSIYFSTKDGARLLAAHQDSGFTVAINPSALTEVELAYTKLVELFGGEVIDREDFFQKASKKDDPYEEVYKRASLDGAKKIGEFDITGLQTFREQWRYYPANSMAAHTIGFIAFKGDDLEGRYGLERQYEGVLSRESKSAYINFFAEIFSNIKETLGSQTTREADIVTTIEPTVQSFLETELQGINQKFDSKHTGGIIINPKTGEIYAMGVYPTFNINEFRFEEDASIFTNSLVEDVYEMGSIIKALTVAIGLDADVILPTTTYEDKGFLELDGYKISNYDGVARGVVDMQEVLNQSLNTGVAFIANKVGNKNFREYMFKLGLNEKTGIDLPNEAANLVENLKSSRRIEHATASYGQGIALTPVATIRALSALANGGFLIEPHIVKQVEYEVGSPYIVEPVQGRRVFRAETSEEISRMLVRVVDEALLGGSVSLPQNAVAAKTGTAQIARTDGGGYYTDRYLHTFFGYFPAYEPKFLILLYTYDPKGEIYASHTLTAPFSTLTKHLINYYEVEPDR